MVKMTIEYQGNLNILNTHEPSGNAVKTAAPVDNNGDGSSFSPTDLFANSLISCMVTIMAIKGNTKNLSIEGTTGSVEKYMSVNPRRISKLVVEINVPHTYSIEDETFLRESGLSCPVAQSVHPDIELDITFNFG